MEQQKKIITFTSVLFIISSAVLFGISGLYLNSETRKDFWSVYFKDPKSGNLDFVVENHSQKTSFEWAVDSNVQKLSSTRIVVRPGEKKVINLINKNFDKKITITVSDGESKKEIYKNFN